MKRGPLDIQEFVAEILKQTAPVVGEGTVTFELLVDVFEEGKIKVSSIGSQKLTFSVEIIPRLSQETLAKINAKARS